MTRSASLPLRFAALLSTAAIIAACTGTTASPSAPASAPAASEPGASASAGDFTGIAYPESGDAPCGDAAYAGLVKKITAVDRLTVEFQLCAPDVAFLPKAAFATFGIQDSDYLAAHATDKSYLTQANGTGPYKLAEWDTGNRMVFQANESYWGEAPKAPNAELRWSDSTAQRLVELKSGAVDGVDNPGREEIDAIKGDSTLQFLPRPAMNTFYIGMNHSFKPWDDVNVRKAIAMGIDSKRIVDNFYPEGSEVASHFTPCPPLVPFGCEGDSWYGFDAAAAKKLLTDANFDFSKTYPLSFRAAVRPYLPDPPVIATEIQTQLRTNLGIETTIDLQESGAFSTAVSTGKLEGLFLYGWGADYPDADQLPRLPLRRRLRRQVRRCVRRHRRCPDEGRDVAGRCGPSGGLHRGQQPHQGERSGRVPHPWRNRRRLQGRRPGRAGIAVDHRDPGGHATGRPGHDGLHARRRTAQRLLRGRVGRRVAPRVRADLRMRSTPTRSTAPKPVPALATECAPNADLSTWTCTLRDGVKFHDGATFDANDVVTTYAVQWDAAHPLHVGNSGVFEYWGGLWNGYLNPPAS